MGRPSKEIFLRDGIYYCRFRGNRWSTETGNESEAMRRTQFMKARNKPWSELKSDFGSRIEIVIDTEGNARQSIVQYYSDSDKLFRDYKNIASAEETSKDGKVEPAKDCKDLETLLNYEYQLKVTADMPDKTLEYYRDRYDALMRFVKRHDLNLATFTSAMAILYPKERLHETLGHPGELGFNNRPAGKATVNKEISSFKSLWRIWKDENRVAENVWARVGALMEETGDVAELEPEPYTLEEVALILSKIQNVLIQNVLLFQCMLGARPGKEVLGITPEAIEKSQIWSFKKRRWDRMEYSAKAKDFYHRNLNGKMAELNSAKIQKAFAKACRLAGVRIGKPYDLRSTFGTEALEDNKIEVVQKLLRHKHLSTTREFYAKTRKPETDQASEKMQRKILRKLTAKAN